MAFVAVLGLVFAWSLVAAPYRQRNDARHALAEAQRAAQDEADTLTAGKINELILEGNGLRKEVPGPGQVGGFRGDPYLRDVDHWAREADRVIRRLSITRPELTEAWPRAPLGHMSSQGTRGANEGAAEAFIDARIPALIDMRERL
ncbi:MAG TPA: hypothetical protein VFP78_06490 [Solirubrobacteraceae bacterium]|nr:hypothetical protein [Solirubrobacteraceae bacterium]